MATENKEQQGVIDDAKRKELVDYYKWIVNLSIFVLTASATISGLTDKDISLPLILIVGWTFLGVCIFFNWMIVKNLMWYPSLQSPRLGIYGTLQNWTFFLGVLLVVFGYAWNIGKAVAFGGIAVGIVSVAVLWGIAKFSLLRANQEAIKTIIEGQQQSQSEDQSDDA